MCGQWRAVPNGGYPEAAGAGGRGCRRQEGRMHEVQRDFQDEDLTPSFTPTPKQRKDQKLPEQRRMLQNEGTAKAETEWCEVFRYVSLPCSHEAGYW